jgi:hypothetical protein
MSPNTRKNKTIMIADLPYKWQRPGLIGQAGDNSSKALGFWNSSTASLV